MFDLLDGIYTRSEQECDIDIIFKSAIALSSWATESSRISAFPARMRTTRRGRFTRG
jgi:hypothetical protein